MKLLTYFSPVDLGEAFIIVRIIDVSLCWLVKINPYNRWMLTKCSNAVTVLYMVPLHDPVMLYSQ